MTTLIEELHTVLSDAPLAEATISWDRKGDNLYSARVKVELDDGRSRDARTTTVMLRIDGRGDTFRVDMHNVTNWEPIDNGRGFPDLPKAKAFVQRWVDAANEKGTLDVSLREGFELDEARYAFGGPDPQAAYEESFAGLLAARDAAKKLGAPGFRTLMSGIANWGYRYGGEMRRQGARNSFANPGSPADLYNMLVAIQVGLRAAALGFVERKRLRMPGDEHADFDKMADGMHFLMDVVKKALAEMEGWVRQRNEDVRLDEGATPGARSKGTGYSPGEKSAAKEFWSRGPTGGKDERKNFNRTQRRGKKKHIDAQLRGEGIAAELEFILSEE